MNPNPHIWSIDHIFKPFNFSENETNYLMNYYDFKKNLYVMS